MNFNRLVSHLKKLNSGVILDIGANKGQWYVEIKKMLPNHHVHMIEADSSNKNHLMEILEPGDSVSICLLGGQYKKDVPFFKTKCENNTGNSVYLENSIYFKVHDTEYLEMMRLDDLLGDKYEQIDLLKLDVQGSEIDIIKGSMEKILPKCQLILMEVSFQPYNKGAPLVTEVLQYMDNIGFQPIDILEKHYFGDIFIQADFLFARRDSQFVVNNF